MPIFMHGIPGDLASAKVQAVVAKDMFSAEPVLEFVSVMSKYGPFKEILFDVWRRRVGESRCQGGSLGRVVSMIAEACVGYAQLDKDIIEPWITHCSQNVSHHMGPLPLCRKLGILVACHRTHDKVLWMGKNCRPVRLASSLQERQVAVARLRRVRNFMAEVEKSRSQGVMTWADCCRFSSELFAAVASTSAPGLEKGSGYTRRWLARSFLFAAGSSGRGIENITTAELAKTFRDAKGWLNFRARSSYVS